jgi:hypothetical protein
MTLTRALDARDVNLFEGDYEIPGVFTRSGWESWVRSEIDRKGEDYEETYWVLGKAPSGVKSEMPPKEAMRAKLSQMYFDEYNQHWWKFLRSIRVRSFASRRDALDRLAKLSRSQDSPMNRLFKSVSSNTWEDLDNKPAGNPYQAVLVKNFQPIHRFVASAENQKPAMSQYQLVLSRVYQELYEFVNVGEPLTQIDKIRQVIQDALGSTASLIQNFDPQSQSVVGPLLERPIRMALSLSPSDEVQPGSGAAGGGGGGASLFIDGFVKSTGGELLGKAIVNLLKAGSREPTFENLMGRTYSDQYGRFRFPQAFPAGRYTVRVSAPGHRILLANVELSPESSQLDLELRPIH